MLNIGRLGVDGAEYYLGTVASGLEEYYLGGGEAPGTWTGSGSAALGLTGEVHAEDLRAVLAGRDPATGVVLGSGRRRVPGFDLTFRAPKSVSLLWGLGDPQSPTRSAPPTTPPSPPPCPTSRRTPPGPVGAPAAASASRWPC